MYKTARLNGKLPPSDLGTYWPTKACSNPDHDSESLALHSVTSFSTDYSHKRRSRTAGCNRQMAWEDTDLKSHTTENK